MVSYSKPGVDPAPLSPYVTWAWKRNRDPILHVFKSIFPKQGNALELASGSGSHINYFAPHFPDIAFQPSDCDESVFETIKENRSRAGNANVADPVRIDLAAPGTWPQETERLYDVIFAINVLHLAPVAAADGFAAIAGRVLKPGGCAALYGPFKTGGRFTTPSNEAFDRSLRESGIPGRGLKDVSDLEKAAHSHGIMLKRQLDLPANNFMLIFEKPETL